MSTQIIEPDAGSPLTRTEIKHRPFSAEGSPRFGAHLTALAISNLSASESRAEPAHPWVVQVDRDRAAGPHPTEQRALFTRDPRQTVQPFEMRRRHGGDHAHVRIGDLGQALDLAGTIGAKLDHRHLVAFVQAQKRQGQADKIVEVTLGFQNLAAQRLSVHVSFFENRRNHFLGRGLAIGSGDRQHFRAELSRAGNAPDRPAPSTCRAP